MNAAPALREGGRAPHSPGIRRSRCGRQRPVTRSSAIGLLAELFLVLLMPGAILGGDTSPAFMGPGNNLRDLRCDCPLTSAALDEDGAFGVVLLLQRHRHGHRVQDHHGLTGAVVSRSGILVPWPLLRAIGCRVALRDDGAGYELEGVEDHQGEDDQPHGLAREQYRRHRHPRCQ